MTTLQVALPEDLRNLAERVAAAKGQPLEALLHDALVTYLAAEADPVVLQLADAPEDDEPTTPEEDEGAEEAWREYLAGKGRVLEGRRQGTSE